MPTSLSSILCPKNTEEVLRRYKKVIIAEQNTGMFARHLRGLIDNFVPHQLQRGWTGQPFSLSHLVEEFIKLIEE